MPPNNTQYESLASTYSNIAHLPGEILTTDLLRRGLGNIRNLNILDLACGEGQYSRMAIALGAQSVTGIDISAEMLRIGQRIEDECAAKMSSSSSSSLSSSSNNSTSRHHSSRITYHQADCTKPLTHLPLQPGTYDLIMTNWLFNYASTRAELVQMWQTIALYLRPAEGDGDSGGRVVGVGELHDVASAVARSNDWVGIRASVCGEGEEATKMHTELLCEPVQVEFDSWILRDGGGSGYREIPVEVGMRGVEFVAPGVEDVPEDCKEVREWREMLVEPYCLLLTATKG